MARNLYRGPIRLGGELLQQRCGKTRFALVESLGVEGFLESEQLVVEMMAELMDQRAQERLECDHLLLLRGTHPDGDARGLAVILGLVQSVQLAVAVGRPARRPSAIRATVPPSARSGGKPSDSIASLRR